MIVGAGLIPLLIQAIENRSPLRLLVVSKTMQLVDNVLYSFTNAFSLFCASRGVDVLVERIEVCCSYVWHFQFMNPLDSMRSTWTSKNTPVIINLAQLTAQVSIVNFAQIVSFDSFVRGATNTTRGGSQAHSSVYA